MQSSFRGRLPLLVVLALLAAAIGSTGCPGPGSPRSGSPRAVGRATPQGSQSELATILKLLRDHNAKQVLVVAHRACWQKGGPENSLPAIRACLELKVDIIEIDVRRSRDGHYILMHDATVDRTTNGEGRVADLTLAELRTLRLKRLDGTLSAEHPPTLAEALTLVRGRALLNLDKAYAQSAELHALLRRSGQLDHALFKGRATLAQARALLASLTPQPLFMPVFGAEIAQLDKVDKAGPARVIALVEGLGSELVELIFTHPADPLASAATLARLRRAGARIWVNSLWDGKKSGGRGDAHAVDNPGRVWGWLVDRGVSVIQTDQPGRLIAYLKTRGLHR
jgi:glycerophosphoryl diester phosphodiesterase